MKNLKSFVFVMVIMVSSQLAIGQINVVVNVNAQISGSPTTCNGAGCFSCSMQNSNGTQYGIREGIGPITWPASYVQGGYASFSKTWNAVGPYQLEQRSRNWSQFNCGYSNQADAFNSWINVNVVNDLVWTQALPASLCAGGSIDLYNYVNHTNVTFYVDNVAMGSSIFNANSYSAGPHTITAGKNFYNKATDLPGVVVTVYNNTSITGHPGNASLCPGSGINFVASATGYGVAYQWQESTNNGGVWNDLSNAGVYSGVTTQTLSISNVSGKNGYQYRMRASNVCNSVNSNAASLNVYSPVQVNGSPGNITVCPNSAAQFIASGAPQFGALSYRWQIWIGGSWLDLSDGAGYSGTGTSTMTYTANNPAATQYRARMSDGCGSLNENATASATRTQYANVQINQHPISTNNCVGSSTNFTASGTAQNGPVSYQWQWFGGNIDGSVAASWLANYGVTVSGYTTGTLSFSNLTSAFNGGPVRCVISDACGSATSVTTNTATLGVYSGTSVSSHPVNQTVCPGSNAVYSVAGSAGNGSLSFQWQISVNSGSSYADLTNANGYSGVNTPTLTLTNVTSGWAGNFSVLRYRCRLRDACGAVTESYSSGATLSLYAQVPISVHPANQFVCPGGNVNFSVTATAQTGTLTYQWQVSTNGGVSYADATGGVYSGVTTSTLTITNINAAFTGFRYRVRVQDGCGASNLNTSNAATLTVYSQPVINTQPPDRTICPNTNTTFNVVATPGNGALSYQWELSTNAGVSYSSITNNVTYSGATTSTLTLTNMSASANNYRYRVIVTDACGQPNQVISSHGTLTFHSQAAITLNPSNMIGCTSTNVAFTSTAIGTGLSYQWQESTNNGVSYNNLTNAGIFSGATSPTLTLTGVTANFDSRRYRVTVTGTCNSVVSTHGVLSVITPPSISADPVGTQVCQNTQAQFLITASGNNLTYQWQKSATGGANSYSSVLGATSSSLTLNSVQTGDEGYYRCIVNNGCATGVPSIGATLVVNPVTEITSQPASAQTCPSSSSQFVVNATGTGLLLYQWEVSTNNGVSFSPITNGPVYTGTTSDHLSIISVPPEMNGHKFRSRVSGTCGPAVTTEPATLVVNPVPASPPSQEVARCGDGVLNATAAAQDVNGEFNWYANANDNIPVYSGATYEVSNLTTSATFFVTVTLLGCESPKSAISFTRHESNEVQLGNGLTLCVQQGAYDLEGDISDPAAKGGTFTWTANGTNFASKSFDPALGVGIYSINYDPPVPARSTPHCYLEATRTITVVSSAANAGISFDGPLVTNGNTINSCIGDNPIDLTSLTSSHDGSWSTVQGSGVSFSGNGVVFTPAEDTYTAINPNIFRYTRTINGCSASKDLNIYVKDNQQKPIITPELPAAICPGTKLNLAATVQAPGSYNYEWYKAGQHTPIHLGNTLQYEVNIPEVLQVRSINLPFGCRSDATLMSINTPFSSGKIVADKVLANVGDGVSFTTDAQASGNSFAWKFGDGFSSIEREPTHFYHQAGEFDVDLTITSNLNCSQSLTFRKIKVVGDAPQLITTTEGSEENVDGINIFPIPAHERVTIRSEVKIISITLFDVNGRRIDTSSTSSGTDISLDLSALHGGLYLIKLVTPKGLHIFTINKL